uniref:Uncharacterized protein n=1 Tax=Panstrongylus lignarius TaxID=156445 RepID=A0A224XUP6_9HEMI
MCKCVCVCVCFSCRVNVNGVPFCAVHGVLSSGTRGGAAPQAGACNTIPLAGVGTSCNRLIGKNRSYKL